MKTLKLIQMSIIVCFFLNAKCYSQNPLFWGADPSGIVAQDGRLFVFPTNDKKDWSDQKDWHCWSTTDTKTWADHGVIFDTKMSGWGVDNAWAPDITYKNGIYYLYYYFHNGEHRKEVPGGIGVATSNNIQGPYKEALGKRMIPGHDPAIFNDDDGKTYLYVQDKVYCLNDDMISVANKEPINLNLEYRPKKFEAAYVFKRNGIYYFTIARDWNNLIYYTGKSPLGPFEFKGEIMKPYGGNNHHSILKYKNDWIIFYHEWAKNESTVSNRRIRAEYIYFNDDGTIQLVKPTKDGISVPSTKD